MLHLLANEVMLKARDIVGEDILDDPEMVIPMLLAYHFQYNIMCINFTTVTSV